MFPTKKGLYNPEHYVELCKDLTFASLTLVLCIVFIIDV